MVCILQSVGDFCFPVFIFSLLLVYELMSSKPGGKKMRERMVNPLTRFEEWMGFAFRNGENNF